jgi:hypothetical protein
VHASWLAARHEQVLHDARTDVLDVIAEPEGQLGRWQHLRYVDFDDERGSLALVLADGRPLTLAVGDRETAQGICAAFRLGGLHLRMTRPQAGILRLHAVWEHWHGVVEGIPALSPLPFTGR